MTQGLAAAAAATVATRLLARKWRLAVAESCTGGLLAKTLTDIPGSSRWFECGWVTYSNEAKQRDLNVSAQSLLLQGAVSEAVVLEMAQGALLRAQADIALSISGVAGPGGGTAINPVGSVWFGVAQQPGAMQLPYAMHEQFPGDRNAIRSQAVLQALLLLQQALK